MISSAIVEREEKSRQLQDRVKSLCTRWEDPIETDVTPTHEATFILLQRELVTSSGLPICFRGAPRSRTDEQP